MNLPEYGRNIFKMVEFLQTIEDRDLRNQQAQVVIDVMGNINNHLRDTDDLKHKLWDHLFIISNFQLDVDSPYPKPDADVIAPKPEWLSYPRHNVRYKHYGKYIEQMLLTLRETEDEEDRKILIRNIAKYMRNKSHEYNQEHPNNEVIINDIRAMSENAFPVEDDLLDGSKSEFRPQTAPMRPKNGKNLKNGKSNGNGMKQNTRKQPYKKY
jgi:hypothetical protein